VVTTPGPVALSPQGRERIAQINVQADAAVAYPEQPSELDARLDALAAQLRDVVDTELRNAGHEATTRTVRERQVASL
jgi:hypothetical protein